MTDLKTALATLREAREAVVLATCIESGEELGQRWIAGSFDDADLRVGASEALVDGASRVVGQVLLEPLQPGRLAPWVHFAGQLVDQDEGCVLSTVIARSGEHPYQVGETFALDDHSHGLLPVDQDLYLALHHAVYKSRIAPMPFTERIRVRDGWVDVLVHRC